MVAIPEWVKRLEITTVMSVSHIFKGKEDRWGADPLKPHEPCGPRKDLHFCSVWDETDEGKVRQDQR